MDHDDFSPSPTHSPTKRARESGGEETDAQRSKREKAAERQRRKRERDRGGSVDSPVGSSSMSLYPPMPPSQSGLTPDEETRKERVRAAARERQRKHRALVKQRKMRELGLDMGNEVMPPGSGPYDDLGYHHHHHIPAGVQIQEMQQLAATAQALGAAAHANSSMAAAVDSAGQFSSGQAPNAGQTFASTLLLSFSCAPLLKQHLLRNLQMTNEELASLEPIIADAWEQWNHQVTYSTCSHTVILTFDRSVEWLTNKRQRRLRLLQLALPPLIMSSELDSRVSLPLQPRSKAQLLILR